MSVRYSIQVEWPDLTMLLRVESEQVFCITEEFKVYGEVRLHTNTWCMYHISSCGLLIDGPENLFGNFSNRNHFLSWIPVWFSLKHILRIQKALRDSLKVLFMLQQGFNILKGPRIPGSSSFLMGGAEEQLMNSTWSDTNWSLIWWLLQIQGYIRHIQEAHV